MSIKDLMPTKADLAEIKKKPTQYFQVVFGYGIEIVLPASAVTKLIDALSEGYTRKRHTYEFHSISSGVSGENFTISPISEEQFTLERLRDVMGLGPEEKTE